MTHYARHWDLYKYCRQLDQDEREKSQSHAHIFWKFEYNECGIKNQHRMKD